MKSKKFFSIILCSLFLGLNVMAQDDASISFVVKYKGAKPTITDFVDAFLTDEADEGSDCDNWESGWADFRSGKPLEKEQKYIVDTRNGYVRIESTYDETTVYSEFCYWNCSDGKHKLVAKNLGLTSEGKEGMTECTGIEVYRYDNNTRKLTFIGWGANGLGLDLGPNPPLYFKLPRVGKNMEYVDFEGRKGVLKWTGNGFSK